MDEVNSSTLRRWDRIELDVLIKIFQELNMVELFPVSQVCRSWCSASSDAWLWDTLDFGLLQSNFIQTRATPYVFVDEPSDRKLTRILQFAFSLSRGNIRCLVFHFNLYMKDQHLDLIVERCPHLKRVVLPAWNRLSNAAILRAIEGWRDLESLTMPWYAEPSSVMEKIGANCRNFTELKIIGKFDMNLATAIKTFLPNLKVLSLRCTRIEKNALMFFVNSLGSLEVLNISHSILLVPVSDLNVGSRIVFQELDPSVLENTVNLREFRFCSDRSCLSCQRMIEDDGMLRWWRYEDWFWRMDEVSSLALGSAGRLFDEFCANFEFRNLSPAVEGMN